MSKPIGLLQGRLHPCPDSPNCVCSQDSDEKHHIDSLTYPGDLQQAKKTLRGIIESLPRTRFMTERDDYWHVEFRTALFRFVDDVEFQFQPGGSRIDVRSASRTGYSDLGVNRKRVEKIRDLFSAAVRAPN